VQCGAPVADRSLEAPSPIIVVEVISPSSRAFDCGTKRDGYFSLPSVQHYLILDPEQRTVAHHFRKPNGGLDSRDLRSSPLRFDPPGLDLDVAALFTPSPSAPR
jgi:Uma2 family endonuclease